MEHILLIEDNPADIALIQSYLRDASFTHRLHKAKSLQEGLDLIRHNVIDIILLDLALDDTAGFHTLRMLLQDVADIPVIVLTGTSNELLGMQIVRAGAQDYLVKGNFDGKQLTRAIRHSMKRFKAQVELRKELWEAQRRDKRYQLLHHLLQLGSWEMDLLNNNMKWNAETYQLLGYHPNSFEPKLADYLHIVHLEDRENIKNFFQEAIRQGKPMQIEHRAVINNRIVKYLSLKAQVISEERNDKIILVGTLQDITEMRMTTNGNAPEVSSNSKRTLSEDQIKLAYNLRQLTDKMLQLLKTLESGGILKQKEHLVHAKEIAAHQLELIYQQINIAVINSGNLPVRKELVQLSTWKNRIAAMIEAKILHLNVMPILHWEHTLPEKVIVDEHLLSLLLFNLIQGGFCIQEEKESLRMSLGIRYNVEKEAFLQLTLQASQYPLSISRRKECITIVKELLQNNDTTQPQSDNGTHHHLVALAKILQALRADFTVTPEQSIEISIPLETCEKEEGIANRPINMLIVEHQTIVQIALKRILQAGMPHISMDFAEDVPSGIQKLSDKDYDLVLVDLQLPNTEPSEVVTAFKETKEIVLIALATEFSKQDKNTLRSLGVEAFVTKPPQREVLLQVIQNLMQA